MRTFTMLMKRGRGQQPQRLDFDAEDPADAFSIARREGGDEPVELWEGSRRLGRLTRMQDELWRIE
ncbi:hypothetical protein GRI75_09835 [Altererythrobacter soli]|uniref:Uncharacterized protein n=1 Tax=Croceibacterium soli TaxID=1739690 RepID=A0A6I4UTH3_9SPHN|nr:hypothetical protein [Croceibacterium soli]MXP41938.1 hypothetical protein [Croceibacterium soli]